MQNSIFKPLKWIFQSRLANGKFSLQWKKANVHKKNDKQSYKNYYPILLLLICSKIFERLLYSNMYNFFDKNNLVSPNQSRFKPGDSCINQLLSIIHAIYKSSDMGMKFVMCFLIFVCSLNCCRYGGIISEKFWSLR